MIDPQSRAALYNVIQHESRSLLKYLSEAFPWTADSDQQAVDKLKELAREEAAAVALVLDYLRRKRILPPGLGSYPMNFTTLNYISLDHLLPILIKHEEQRLADIEAMLAKVEDGGAKTHLKEIMALKQRLKQGLESLLRSQEDQPSQQEQSEPETVSS